MGRWCCLAGKVTASLAESNGSPLPGGWLIVTFGLTACTLGLAPVPTLGNEYGKSLPLLFTTFVFLLLLVSVWHVLWLFADRLLKEMVCSLITSLLAMPLSILLFIPVYHGLHDGFRIHSEICVLLFLALLFLVAWTGDRRPSAQARIATVSGIWLDVLMYR